jgi:hypothetical protein
MRRAVVMLVTLLGSIFLSASAAAQPSDDERQLRDIQQQLARAWKQKDRAFIESVLAPEWSVTQPDGQVLARATVVGPFFDAITLDTSIVDDVTVTLFGDAAVVRGRTVAAGKFNGAPVSARIRFTDVFVKRRGQWQAVASHASPLSENPFVGNWTANIAKSKLDPRYQFQSVALRIIVAGDTVTMASDVVDALGKTQRAEETFRTDGTETPGTLNPGVLLVARWVGSQVLATIAKKDGQMIGLITYEVSSDGKTLTSRSSGLAEQVIVFERR